MQLKRLVLPAPFGPIRPTIWPSTMSNETLSSAATPPKRRLTSRTDNSGSSNTLNLRWPFAPDGGHLRTSAGDDSSALGRSSADRCAPFPGTKNHSKSGESPAHCPAEGAHRPEMGHRPLRSLPRDEESHHVM